MRRGRVPPGEDGACKLFEPMECTDLCAGGVDIVDDGEQGRPGIWTGDRCLEGSAKGIYSHGHWKVLVVISPWACNLSGPSVLSPRPFQRQY